MKRTWMIIFFLITIPFYSGVTDDSLPVEKKPTTSPLVEDAKMKRKLLTSQLRENSLKEVEEQSTLQKLQEQSSIPDKTAYEELLQRLDNYEKEQAGQPQKEQ